MAPANNQIAKDIEKQARDVLRSAVIANRDDLVFFISLQNVTEQIGAQYGDRVLYELIQNAHDAHSPGGTGAGSKSAGGKDAVGKGVGDRGHRGRGKIAVKLVIRSDNDGDLYIANGGSGFSSDNVRAITNVAFSSKEVGEGIGNKGLGFRSIETLTDDVRIFSQLGMGKSGAKRFNGYCFGFCSTDEIEAELRSFKKIKAAVRNKIAGTMPRYMVPKYLDMQPAEVTAFAGEGYATVIVAPLKTAEAVNLARKQVKLLSDLDVPLLLFLERIAEVKIDIQQFDRDPFSCSLKKRQKSLTSKISLATKKSPTTKSSSSRLLKGSTLHEVDVGGQSKFLVVRHQVDMKRVRDAVEKSIPSAHQLKDWRDWRGQPTVSVAVGLSNTAVTNARLYNFLPMGKEAKCALTGYIDAPFFTDIDRRGLDISLPLNDMLMEVAAEVCASTALAIVEHGLPIKPQAVFDLFAWTGQYAYKLDEALVKYGSSLRDAQLIPAIADRAGNKWASISEVSVWPEGSFTELKDREVAKHVGARLVSGELDAQRVKLLKEIALYRAGRTLAPSGAQLAEWSEAFAKSLLDRKSGMRTWSRFYNDLPNLFSASNVGLDDLVGRWILLDQSGRLKPSAGSRNSSDASDAKVYVRGDMPKGTRNKTGVPLPPASLARRYRFLKEGIELKPRTLDSFFEAGLLRKYDPIEALVGLKFVFAAKPTPKQREEALVWAFKVWRTATERVDDKLREAELHVPTRSGWQLASHAVFSPSWTNVGQTLETYLIDSAETSADCERARDLMLIGTKKWPVSIKSEKARWVSFLKLIGVEDGLRPVPAGIDREGLSGSVWNGVLRNGESAEGLDEDWCAEVNHVSFRHPTTDDYTIRNNNEVWRFPGQIEHETLSNAAKEGLCNLIFEHLKVYGTEYFHFEVGRFGRDEQHWDQQQLPTPLATFLRTKPWIAVTTRSNEDGMGFRRPNGCWASRTRNGRAPIFMDRMSEAVANISDDGTLADIVFGKEVGLRDWQSKYTAVDRLIELAGVATSLAPNEKPAARNAYKDAWESVVATDDPLPSDLALMVNRRGHYEVLSGNTEAPSAVIVTDNAQSPAVRILYDSGMPVLEVGQKLIDKIVVLLKSTGAFGPLQSNGKDVQLRVNGKRFAPSSSDEFLMSQELKWLPEFIAIGNEIRGEQFERSIPSAAILKRASEIRLRRCESMNLMVNNKVLQSSAQLNWYAYSYKKPLTLIVTDEVEFDWKTLTGPLFDDVLRLVHGNLKTPRYLIAQLGIHIGLQRKPTDLGSLSDEELAQAFNCDIQTVQEHRQAFRSNDEQILDRLVPVVAYYADVRLARQLRRDAEQQGEKFKLLQWLQLHMSDVEHSPDELMNACKDTTSPSEVRKRLGLDYERFNAALLDLGESPLYNETELRRLYKAHLGGMESDLVDRLRRHYADDFRQGRNLAEYVERKSFAFLEFNSEWTHTRETLDMELVEEHVSKRLDEVLGKVPDVNLDPLSKVLAKNRKSVGKFVEQAFSLLPIWCDTNSVLTPHPWSQSDGQAVVRYLENSGLLDFDVIEVGSIPNVCRRAACWPSGMPKTLDPKLLGLDKGDIEKHDRQQEKEKRQRALDSSNIEFAGKSLDTEDAMFDMRIKAIAAECLSKDANWLDRCQQETELLEFDDVGQPKLLHNGRHNPGADRPRPSQPTDAQRRTMGSISEWRVYNCLSDWHGKAVTEKCWVSKNRARFLSGSPGDDTKGFDFLVNTPEADYMYEVKSSLDDSGEFELTANELRVASEAAMDCRKRYRILYVPYVFSSDRWRVIKLPNPMEEATRNQFEIIGHGSVRLRFVRK